MMPSSLRLIIQFLFITFAIFGCLVSDPDFKPNDKDAIIASERRVVIETTPTVVPVKNKPAHKN